MIIINILIVLKTRQDEWLWKATAVFTCNFSARRCNNNNKDLEVVDCPFVGCFLQQHHGDVLKHYEKLVCGCRFLKIHGWNFILWVLNLLEVFCNANPIPKMLCFWKSLTSKRGFIWRWVTSGNLIQILVPAMETFIQSFLTPEESSCSGNAAHVHSAILTRDGPKSWYLNILYCFLFWNNHQF